MAPLHRADRIGLSWPIAVTSRSVASPPLSPAVGTVRGHEQPSLARACVLRTGGRGAANDGRRGRVSGAAGAARWQRGAVGAQPFAAACVNSSTSIYAQRTERFRHPPRIVARSGPPPAAKPASHSPATQQTTDIGTRLNTAQRVVSGTRNTWLNRYKGRESLSSSGDETIASAPANTEATLAFEVGPGGIDSKTECILHACVRSIAARWAKRMDSLSGEPAHERELTALGPTTSASPGVFLHAGPSQRTLVLCIICLRLPSRGHVLRCQPRRCERGRLPGCLRATSASWL